MEPKAIVGLTMAFAFTVLPLLIVLVIYLRNKKANRDSQRVISDPDLLRLINNQPDQLISPHLLRDQTELTIHEARSRLSNLMMYGILNRSVGGSRYYYSLKESLPEEKNLSLSPDPFLTVEDLLTIFEVHNYRVSAQDLILTTGLPLNVLKREMKHFQKRGIVQSMRGMVPQGAVSNRFFTLQEPYRSNPERFRARAGQLDLELKEILLNENLIV
ncbi:hypothetical protein [Neolewinella persica]|uniref:hypothetical protein n=1 Tax=Neolewinella persica TaxID=70998 RepID=UPI0003723A8E|nr:hypothetical protein [Neolewinella persica]